MKITDLIALAKAGYTPADVKELVSLEKEGDVNNAASMLEDKTEAGTVKAPEKEPEPAPAEVDYKALYEAEKKKVEDFQNSNTRKEVEEPEISVDSIVKDISSYLI